jgi:hypothetical protein
VYLMSSLASRSGPFPKDAFDICDPGKTLNLKSTDLFTGLA